VKRVLIVSRFFSWPPRSGADTVKYQFGTALRQHGYDVRLVTCGEVRDPDGLGFGLVKLNRRRFDLYTFSLLVRKEVKRFSPDISLLTQPFSFLDLYRLVDAVRHTYAIYHLGAYFPFCPRRVGDLWTGDHICETDFFSNGARCMRCLACGVPGWSDFWKVQTIRRLMYDLPVFLRPRMLVEKLKLLDQIFVVNRGLEAMFRKTLGEDVAVDLLPNGVDTDIFFPTSKGEVGELPIVYLPGRASDPAKGFQFFLDAAQELIRQGILFKVRVDSEYCMGPVRLPFLETLPWSIDQKSQAEKYRSSDIVVVPSVQMDACPLVVSESLSSGVPVVASRIGGIPEILQHEKEGYLVPPRDPNVLSDYLRRLILDPHLRRRMGRRGRQSAESKFDWRKILNERFLPRLPY